MLLTEIKLCLFLLNTLKEQGELKDNMVVSTVMSNIGFYKAVEEHGMQSVKTSVGDRYVVEEMRNNNYSLGGEQSGHNNTYGTMQLPVMEF